MTKTMMTREAQGQDDLSHRDQLITLTRESGDADTYTFPLSSEAPYRRWRGIETLVHDKSAVDLSFLNSGTAPFCLNHDTYGGQIGVVTKAWLQDKRVYVTVRFSNRANAQEIKRDVDDGIMRNVSVGYNVLKVEHTERDDDAPREYRVTSWKPMEASIVSIPADETVGVGRASQPQEGIMTPEEIAAAAAAAAAEPTSRTGGMPLAVLTDDQRAENMETAINEIVTLGEQHSRADLARDFIHAAVRNGEEPSLAMFRGVMRSNLPEDVPLENTNIGMTNSEAARFSVVSAMRALETNNWEGAGLEREAITAAETAGRAAQYGGVMLPTDLMDTWGDFQRDGISYQGNSDAVAGMIRAAMATGGNANVLTTAHLANRFIDNLRNQSAFMRAGVTMLPGLSDNVDIPGGDQNIAAAWLASEDANVAESVPTFRKISLTPHDLGAYVDMTRRMLQQSTIAMEAYARMQMVDAQRIAIDHAIGYGTGATGIPEGIANTTGIGAVTFAAAVPTRDEIIDLRTSIAETNRGRGVSYIANSAMVGDLQKTRVDAGSGIFLMGDNADRLVGNTFIESNQITDGDLFCGVFSDVMFGMWGGLELARSTEAKFLSGGIRYRVIQTVDVDFARVGSFSMGNDG